MIAAKGRQATRVYNVFSPLPPARPRVSRSESFVYQCTTVSFALCVSVCGLSYLDILVLSYWILRSPPRSTSSQPIARLRPEIVIPVSVCLTYPSYCIIVRSVRPAGSMRDPETRDGHVARRRAYRSRSAAILLFVTVAYASVSARRGIARQDRLKV